MKTILLILALLAAGITSAQVQWMTMNEALAAQKKEPRKILLKSYTDTCRNCKWMDKYAFAKAGIATYINTHYYPVKFDVEGKEPITYKGKDYGNPQYKKFPGAQHEFAEAMQIFEYPTLIFFDKEANVINPIPGKMGPKKLEIYITMIANDAYKNIKTGRDWAVYQENFEYRLQD